ncbi:hypothetical protein SERLADRAFT_472537 [Serpula lacrymans var. lacrymans S7.9]|uniref:Uncharacterized protein n=1 Tax=Serpula lacrymans var. lacrymans (strain S7.9) TaxID=578457 RepID=F8P3Q0_SERL9|nr:uncharacterized protein SERLADRAFT_472537 [Serpula lacrymans var. lacrymans S7.9]EGO22149.1 hypothetical protein SERLADRAFT_472537 [Serpula lacrymans var. lacrymans S7.9]
MSRARRANISGSSIISRESANDLPFEDDASAFSRNFHSTPVPWQYTLRGSNSIIGRAKNIPRNLTIFPQLGMFSVALFKHNAKYMSVVACM